MFLSSTTTSVQHPTWLMRWLPQDNGASALTTHQIQMERRERHRANQVYTLTTHQLQVERRERHRANQVYALTTHQLQVERRERHRANQVYALTHTPDKVRGERDIEPIKCMHSHTPDTVERRKSHRVQSSVCDHHTPATGGEEKES